MNPSQNLPVEEQILLTVADQSKLDLVMELLSHFDLVRAERVKAMPKAPKEVSAEAEADFWALAGIWKDRDIDLKKIRQESFDRRTKNYDR
ncbi:hypothetical protein ACFP2F_13655 [Hymenobacter artigasi]|uniref:DUF2281 domain-containing protein n=1 Tax=Hymenobacter artigasi TaxID=2719616 RepID=A0ABX1HLG0_9BACT|nr:hypothetical protein [Hymenobacter artigasi]NKI90655.1 hypothetical protein [Hymenobacter artigasi]